MVRSFKRSKDGVCGRWNSRFWYSLVSLSWHKRILSEDKVRFVVENNSMSGLEGFGTGFRSYVQAQGTLVNNTNLTDETGKVLNPATPEEIKY